MRAQFHRGTADVCFVDHSLGESRRSASLGGAGAGSRSRVQAAAVLPRAHPPPLQHNNAPQQTTPTRSRRVTPEVMMVASRGSRTKAPSATPSRHRLFLFSFFFVLGLNKAPNSPPLPRQSTVGVGTLPQDLHGFAPRSGGKKDWGGGG